MQENSAAEKVTKTAKSKVHLNVICMHVWDIHVCISEIVAYFVYLSLYLLPQSPKIAKKIT